MSWSTLSKTMTNEGGPGVLMQLLACSPLFLPTKLCSGNCMVPGFPPLIREVDQEAGGLALCPMAAIICNQALVNHLGDASLVPLGLRRLAAELISLMPPNIGSSGSAGKHPRWAWSEWNQCWEDSCPPATMTRMTTSHPRTPYNARNRTLITTLSEQLAHFYMYLSVCLDLLCVDWWWDIETEDPTYKAWTCWACKRIEWFKQFMNWNSWIESSFFPPMCGRLGYSWLRCVAVRNSASTCRGGISWFLSLCWFDC